MEAKELYLECAEICASLIEAGLTPKRLIIDENTYDDLKDSLNAKGTIYCVDFPNTEETPIQVIPSKSKIISFAVKT